VNAFGLAGRQRINLSEKSFGRKWRAVDHVVPDRTRFVGAGIVRGQGTGIAPVTVEIIGFLRRRRAAGIEQQAAAADRQFVDDNPGFGGGQRRVQGWLRIGWILGPGQARRVECVGGRQDSALCREGTARDLGFDAGA
jgi:hypothetical protein